MPTISIIGIEAEGSPTGSFRSTWAKYRETLYQSNSKNDSQIMISKCMYGNIRQQMVMNSCSEDPHLYITVLNKL